MIALFAPAALATTWWVADPQEAEAVRAALDARWPGHGVDVRIGPPGDGDGVWTEDGVLIARLDGEEHWLDAAEPQVQVVLVRSWARDLQVDDEGWIPDVPDPPAPAPDPVAPDPRGPLFAAAVGSAVHTGDGDGLATGALEGGVRVGRVGGLMRLEGHTLGHASDETFDYRVRSLAVTVGFAGWSERVPELSWSVGVGVRARHYSAFLSPPIMVTMMPEWTTTHPTARGSLRWTEDAGLLRVGAGVSLQADAPLHLDQADAEGGWPVLAAAELVLEHR